MITSAATELVESFEQFSRALEIVRTTVQAAIEIIKVLLLIGKIYRHTAAEFFIPISYFYLNIVAQCRSPPNKN